jgi:predicted nucleic acid-binding protein
MSAAYFDTGILLNLYTLEPSSERVQEWVRGRGQPIAVTDLHLSEAVSAMRLKQFRGECTAAQAAQAIAHIEDDIRSRVLRRVDLDWPAAWLTCRTLAQTSAAQFGTRTLDTLHVACALLLHATECITSDHRQAELAATAGLAVRNPADPT